MSGTQNKVLGKRSKNSNVPELEVVALGNRKKPVPLINTSNLSSAGKLMEYDEKINTPSSGSNTPDSILKKQKVGDVVVQPPIFGGGGGTTVPPPLLVPSLQQASSSPSPNHSSQQQQQSQQPPSIPIRTPPIPPHLLQQQIQQRQNNHNNNNNNNHNHNQNNQNNNHNHDMDSSSSLIELIQSIENEKDGVKATKIVKSILVAMKSHLLTSSIPSSHLFSGDADKSPYVLFLQMVKRNTSIFQIPDVLDMLLGLYRRDPTQMAQPQAKKNILVQVFASVVLFAAYEHVPDWPATFFYIYSDDAIGDRLWVDDINCKPFCQSIQSSLPNRQSNQSNQQQTSQPTTTTTSFKPSPPPVLPTIPNNSNNTNTNTNNNNNMVDSDEEIEEEIISSSTTVMIQSSTPTSTSSVPRSKFQHCHLEIVRYIIQTIKSFNAAFNPRGLLRLLLLTVGFKESRAEGAQLIEQLLTNQNVFRAAKEYLQALLHNCCENSPEDIRAVQILMRVQVHSSVSTDIIPTLLGNNSAYASIALRQAVELELEMPGTGAGAGAKGASAASTVGGKSRLSIIFKHMLPLRAEEELASIIKELCVREDYAVKVVSRMIIRKIIKQFPAINMPHFCNQLTDISKDEQYLGRDPMVKERWAHNLVHAMCQVLLLIPSTTIPGSQTTNPNTTNTPTPNQAAATTTTQQTERDMSIIRSQISTITDTTTTWCANLFNLFISSPTDIIDMIKRILFLEPINTYFPTTITIIDSDRVSYRILSNEIQIQENFGVGVQFSSANVGGDVLVLSEIGAIGQVRVSNAQLFWQAVIIVCFIVCLSPSTVGKVFWQACPTIRTVLEMIVTRLWRFPPYAAKSISPAQIQALDQAAHAKEQEILAVLAEHQQSTGGPIIILDIPGCARQPPNEVVERLVRLDNDLHMSYLLCQSRQPDFLLEIMASQESRTSLQWLVQIIHTDPRTLDILPPMCLAEVLLMADHSSVAPIAAKIVNRIGTLITNSATSTLEFIKFFFTNLSSPSHQIRHSTRVAIASLPHLKSPATTTTTTTTMTNMFGIDLIGSIGRIPTQLPWFDQVADTIYHALLKALLVETDTLAIRSHLQYLYDYSLKSNNQQQSSLSLHIAKIIINRKIISRFLLNDPITKPIILDLFAISSQLYHDQEEVNEKDEKDEKVKEEDEEMEQEEKVTITKKDGKIINIPKILIDAIIYSICNVGDSSGSSSGSGDSVGSGDSIDSQEKSIKRITTNLLESNKSYSQKILYSQDVVMEALQSNNQVLVDMAIEQLDESTLINYSLDSLTISSKARQSIKLITNNSKSERKGLNGDEPKKKKKSSILSTFGNSIKQQEQQQDIELIKEKKSINQPSTTTTKTSVVGQHVSSSSSSSRTNHLNLKEIIRDTPIDLLEEILGKLFGNLFFTNRVGGVGSSSSTVPVLNNLIQSLIESIENLPNDHPSIGLLLDWLSVLVNQMQPDQSIVLVYNLMFGLPRRPFSTFLLSHFIHKSSWSTLSAFVQYLLRDNNNYNKEDSLSDQQSILTFINAYHCHPRSSAPYYSANPSQLVDSLLYHFTTSSICLFANHIAKAQQQTSLCPSSSSSPPTIKRSIVLLTSAAHISPNHLSTLVHYLWQRNNCSSASNSNSNSNILLQLYYSFPSTIKSLLPEYSPPIMMINNNNNNNDVNNNNNNVNMPTTQLDIPIHRVILKIYEPEQRRDAFILFQKLAYDHPELITIHLPSVLALFAGRSYIALDQFIIKRYHILYCDILDIINLLGHCVFSSPHLDQIVQEYFLFLSNVRIHVDELIALVCKFMEFLPTYQKFKIDNDIIIKNIDHLELISNIYPISKQSFIKIQLNICCFHVLDTNIPNINNQQQQQQNTNNNNWLIQHQLQLNQDIEKLKIDLQEQINVGQQERYIIKLVDDIYVLAQLINCNRDRVRLSAYTLLRELLLSSPTKSISDRIVQYYSATFYSPNADVIKSALCHAGTMLLFANHSQTKLIQRMLHHAGKESLPEIRRLILPFIKIYC
ncbi:integrator complex subunit 1 [Cavenderia fasciculata]|uniref:Integrator complex subunit 1 n=1 Tax=Cavenderia fasciculata TaxID=261658 RepID=F4PU59_CACFS|nr:integrator complex subunit 1 [Cavenderia fasciculata]EGG20985.1 integrator complex subunit 1 [Cavenderia fasciculata]|eukprot:XP_004358835.1 integrator complex subunit 1 [Cavenderia fasciculata]